jgi:CTP-dependent riboflavin kinase
LDSNGIKTAQPGVLEEMPGIEPFFGTLNLSLSGGYATNLNTNSVCAI